MTEAVQLPAFLANRPSRGLAQATLSGLSTGSPPYIGTRANRFKLVDAAGNEKLVQTLHLDGVIVDANEHISKIYYDVAFDPNATEFKPPACFSDNGLAPSRASSKPQHTNCRECPHNQWGSETSRLTGKATKACNDIKKVAFLVDGMAFVLRIPPASLKNLASYVRTLAGQSIGDRSVSPEDVVTRLTFEEGKNGIISFTAAAWVDEATATLTADLWAKKATDDLVGRNDQPFTGAIGVTTLPPAQQIPQQQLPPPPAPPTQAGVATPPPPATVVPPPVDTPKKGRGRPAKTESDAEQAARLQDELDKLRAKLNPAASGISQAKIDSALGSAPLPTQAAQANPDDIPPFLRRTAEPPAQPPRTAQPQFGMQSAPEPNAALMEALNLALPPANGG